MAKVGRPLSTEQMRLLIALIGALANRGDAVVLSSIIARLGVSEDEARSIIDTLVDLAGISPGFSVAEIDAAEGVSIPSTMESHGKALRLTLGETVAIDAALERLGVAQDDPLRTTVLEAIASPAVAERDQGRMARQFADPAVASRIMTCSQALYYGTGLRFLYKGSSDDEPRERRAMPLSISENEGFWYLEAVDAKTGGHKSFRFDRMDEITEDLEVEAPAPIEAPEHMVELSFSNTAMLELLEWPRLELLGDPATPPVRARIPYYGGLWLVRRLAACGSSVEIFDEELREAVRAYAASQLG